MLGYLTTCYEFDKDTYFEKQISNEKIKENNLKDIEEDAIMEILKYLCRRANSKKKIK